MKRTTLEGLQQRELGLERLVLGQQAFLLPGVE